MGGGDTTTYPRHETRDASLRPGQPAPRDERPALPPPASATAAIAVEAPPQPTPRAPRSRSTAGEDATLASSRVARSWASYFSAYSTWSALSPSASPGWGRRSARSPLAASRAARRWGRAPSLRGQLHEHRCVGGFAEVWGDEQSCVKYLPSVAVFWCPRSVACDPGVTRRRHGPRPLSRPLPCDETMADVDRKRVIPLIECRPDGEYVANLEALALLRPPRSLAVVACAGKFRTGKSLLLNRLSECNADNGFGGDTVNAHKGCGCASPSSACRTTCASSSTPRASTRSTSPTTATRASSRWRRSSPPSSCTTRSATSTKAARRRCRS